jgi:RND family efflux transporter MFP subunit
MTDPESNHQCDLVALTQQPTRETANPLASPRSLSQAPPASSGRRLRVLVLVTVLLLIGAGVVIYVMITRHSAAGKLSPIAEPLIPVATVPVERGTVTSSQIYDGEFLSFEQIDVHPEVAGFLKTILVDEGDHVTADQLLATLEIPGLDDDIARAQAQREHDKSLAAKTKATYEVDHQTFMRLKGVAAQQANLIAQQDIDEANSKDLASIGAWQAAVSQEAVSKAELDKLFTYQRFCRITAPFAGAVTKRFVDPGALVQGGVAAGAQITALVSLSQIDVLRLSFPVTESIVPRVHVGQSVSYRIGALSEVKQGIISRFTQRVDNATRTMEGRST